MFLKPLSQIDRTTIENLVEAGRMEDTRLEFKLGRPDQWSELDNDLDDAEKARRRWKEKREFLKDVTAMANARGGDLIYGMAEARGKAGKTLGFPCDNPDALGLELQQLCENHTEPPLRINLEVIEGFERGPILVIRVPESWQKPHAVHIQGARYFWCRYENSSRPMTMTEIRQTMIGWSDVQEGLREFRRNRIQRLAEGNAPILLCSKRLVALHIVPIKEFARHIEIDVREQEGEPTWQVPLCGGQFSTSFNVDGRLTCTRERSDGTVNRAYDYTLLFRNGTLEGVTSSLIPEHMDELHPKPIAREICRTIRKWIPGLQFRDLDGPYFIALSLLGFEGVRRSSEVFSGRRSSWPIPDQVVMLSDILVDEFNEDPADALWQLWDYLWQTFGLSGFDDNARKSLI